MKYNVEQLLKANQGWEFLFFWSHLQKQEGVIGKECFSQWWPAPFTVNGVFYPTAEHWMMAKKAELFQDFKTLALILAADSPGKVKDLGRQVENYDDQLWIEYRYQIVKEGNYHKFNQNEDLKSFLLQTKTRVLVEASPVDVIWGIGFASDHPNAEKPENWRGLNLLGFALMEVRDEL